MRGQSSSVLLDKDGAMKALILYAAFVVGGAALSVFVGLTIEREVSSPLSLLVFLSMFMANFAVAWILTVLVMDGTLKDFHGRQEQRDVERIGQATMAKAIAGGAPGTLPD
jgi:hypothetical protein